MVANSPSCIGYLPEFDRSGYRGYRRPSRKAIPFFGVSAIADEIDNMIETPHDFYDKLPWQQLARKISGEEFCERVTKRISIASITDEKAVITAQFERLKEQWKRDTLFHSSLTDICMHPSYQQIIGMGKAALPHIFRELRRELGHWSWALQAITGDDPVLPGHEGYIDKIAADWLEYGRQHGWS